MSDLLYLLIVVALYASTHLLVAAVFRLTAPAQSSK
jgi:hypothetical protein